LACEYGACRGLQVTSNFLTRVLPVLSRHNARAPNLFSSGGVAHTDDLLSTTFRCSEAEAFADRMRACGVPNDSILREPLSKNTGAHVLTCAYSNMSNGGRFYQATTSTLHVHLATPAAASAASALDRSFRPTGALLADRDIPLPSRALVVTKPYM